MKTQRRVLSFILALVFLAGLAGTTYAAAPAASGGTTIAEGNGLRFDYEKDGSRYSFFAMDASGNTVLTANLDPMESAGDSYYMFNPMALGIELGVQLEDGLEDMGNGGPCPVIWFDTPLVGCCGISGYVQLSESNLSEYSAILLCTTESQDKAMVYSDLLSHTQDGELLIMQGISKNLYNRQEAKITAIQGLVIAPAYNSDSTVAMRCTVEEWIPESLTLHFRSGEEACACLASLLTELGLPENDEEDYYYTENGSDYWYIPIGGTRSDAICVSMSEAGYYAVDSMAFGTDFFHGDYTSELVAGDSSVFYVAAAETIQGCMGFISQVKPEPANSEAMTKYNWGIGIKEHWSGNWFFMDYFDYVAALRSAEWTQIGLLYPEPADTDGFIVCPMEYFEESFLINYLPGGVFLFAEGEYAMRFMRQLDRCSSGLTAAPAETSQSGNTGMSGSNDAYLADYRALIEKTMEEKFGFYEEDMNRGRLKDLDGDGYPELVIEYYDQDTIYITIAKRASDGTTIYYNQELGVDAGGPMIMIVAGMLSGRPIIHAIYQNREMLSPWFRDTIIDISGDEIKAVAELEWRRPRKNDDTLEDEYEGRVDGVHDEELFASYVNTMTEVLIGWDDLAKEAHGDYLDDLMKALTDEGGVSGNTTAVSEPVTESGSTSTAGQIQQLNPNVKVGDIVSFGSYEQDNNPDNGKEDIEWLVLAKENDRILVISKYVLDGQVYHSTDTDITWEGCSLRLWLNNEFLTNAFSPEQQKSIPTVTVSADKNPYYDTNPGNTTQDQVFLLSCAEAQNYLFDKNEDAIACEPTEYAKTRPGTKGDDGCYWWLRSPGYQQNSAANGYTGKGFGSIPVYAFGAVRPALWINLKPSA